MMPNAPNLRGNDTPPPRPGFFMAGDGPGFFSNTWRNVKRVIRSTLNYLWSEMDTILALAGIAALIFLCWVGFLWQLAEHGLR